MKNNMRTKHVAFLALILLLPWLSACTESGAMPITMLGGGVTAAGPAPTYIFEENFAGSTDCYSGDGTYQTCDNTWTVSDTSITNFQATGLDGTYAVDIDPGDSGVDSIEIGFTDTAHAYGYFMFHFDTQGFSTVRQIVELRGGDGGTNAMRLAGQWDDKPDMYCGSGEDATGPFELSAATTYHLWWEYDYASGAGNLNCRIWIAETSTKPVAAVWEVTGATGSVELDYMELSAMDGESEGRFDKIRVDDVVIGNSPQ